MRIKKFTIENYKALQGRHEFEPDGHSFFIIGGNGRGKTSAGQAMIDLLTKKFPSQPVTSGEKEGYIEFELDTGAKLYAKLSQNGRPKVEFITGDGINVGSPKELLSSLAGDAATFSIDEFLSLSPKPRREMMERIQGIDLSELNEREDKLMEERKLLKRQLKDQEARVEPYDSALVGTKPQKPADLLDELQQMKDYNSNAQNLNTRADQLSRQKDDLENQIRELQKKLTDTVNMLSKIQEEASVLKPYSEDEMDAVKRDLEKVEERNEEINKANQAHEEYERCKKLQEKVDEAETAVKSVREKKEELLQSNPLPADGLEWSEDGDLLLDGLPFETNQIAASRKVIAGLQIAEALSGKIKYLHFDASVLDQNSAHEIVEWAEKKGMQLCLERAQWEGGELKFEVIDNSQVVQEYEV